MRHIRALALATLSASACATAQPRVLPKGTASVEGGLVSVAGGTYTSADDVVVDLTYVADPSTGVCFAAAFVIGVSDGANGIMPIDCCRLRHVPEVASALPSLATSCAAAAPAPAAGSPASAAPAAAPPAS